MASKQMFHARTHARHLLDVEIERSKKLTHPKPGKTEGADLLLAKRAGHRHQRRVRESYTPRVAQVAHRHTSFIFNLQTLPSNLLLEQEPGL